MYFWLPRSTASDSCTCPRTLASAGARHVPKSKVARLHRNLQHAEKTWEVEGIAGQEVKEWGSNQTVINNSRQVRGKKYESSAARWAYSEARLLPCSPDLQLGKMCLSARRDVVEVDEYGGDALSPCSAACEGVAAKARGERCRQDARPRGTWQLENGNTQVGSAAHMTLHARGAQAQSAQALAA